MQEPLTEVFTFAMTYHEKSLMHQLAFSQGATMSGLVRKLNRDAAAEKLQSTFRECASSDRRGEEKE